MIDEVDRRLADWITGVLGDIGVSYAPLDDEEVGQGVRLYLMDLMNKPVARDERTPPMQIMLRYLVTAWAEDVLVAHRFIAELAFSALESQDFEVERDPVSLDLWLALGVPPRPAFVLKVPLRREKAERPVRPVLETLVLHQSPMTRLEGIVLGPGEVPIPGAEVVLLALNRNTRTDGHGRFRFDAVPENPPPGRLRVKAKGWQKLVALDEREQPDQPVVVHMEMEV